MPDPYLTQPRKPPLPAWLKQKARECERAAAQTLKPTPQEAAQIKLDVRRMCEHAAKYDTLMRVNNVFVHTRTVAVNRTLARRPWCCARSGLRSGRPGSRRTISTRAGPDDESGESEPPGGRSAGGQRRLLAALDRQPRRGLCAFVEALSP
jgi:hypothetical protein